LERDDALVAASSAIIMQFYAFLYSRYL